MDDVPACIIAIGTRLCFEGGLWEVAEVTATDPSARLLDVVCRDRLILISRVPI